MVETPVSFEIEMPNDWEAVHLITGVHRRLHDLLDKQDAGQMLTPGEAEEAQRLVDLAEWLSSVRLHSERVVRETPAK